MTVFSLFQTLGQWGQIGKQCGSSDERAGSGRGTGATGAPTSHCSTERIETTFSSSYRMF